MNITDSNPYNNYTPCRKDLMSLSTINNNDFPTRKFKSINTNRDWSTNLYNLDIEGSTPKIYDTFHHKVDFINKVDDIDRTYPKQLHIKLDKPEYNLTNQDIDGSTSKCWKFQTTRSPSNPLEPKYTLPKFETYPYEVPRFIRDSININDIDGARPKRYSKWQMREGMFNHDIPGSSPKVRKERKPESAYHYYDYSDVTNSKFNTKRCVNPLDPIYELRYKNGETFIHGNIPGNKPATDYKYNYPNPFNLKVDDIDGTQTGSKNRINKFVGNNSNLLLDDIKGAQSGSLKKGITTMRKINPLMPDYMFPGQKELGKNNNPYGDTLFTKPSTKNSEKKEEYIQKKDSEIKINKNCEEVIGFNDQIYYEEKKNFDPNKFQKPEPFYGFIHDKYLISDGGNKLTKKPSETIKQVNKNETNLRDKGKVKASFLNSSNAETAASYKHTFAQKLDQMIG